MKRIVIFIDGTWNRPDAEHQTNVVRLARCVHHRTDGGMPQMVIYSPGVGSGRGNTVVARKFDRLLGGALGWGLTDIIEETYRNLIFTYQPGDEIMVFGFSRGGFAARSLVGLIRSCGILRRSDLRSVPLAMQFYMERGDDTHPGSDRSHRFRAKHSPEVVTSEKELAWRERHAPEVAEALLLKVAYLGVWDTVSGLGIPAFLPWAARVNRQYRFHDTRLSSLVLAARHAISIDERRATFPAFPWSNLDTLNRENLNYLLPSHMQQWFPGNHGSVGGGGSRIGLSSIALHWVALGAQAAGLAIDWEEFDRVAHDFDVTEQLDNKFGPVGLASVLNVLTKDRAGPAGLEELSMAAIDRCFVDGTYKRNPTLAQVYHQLHGMQEGERSAIREARRQADGWYTHLPDRISRPR